MYILELQICGEFNEVWRLHPKDQQAEGVDLRIFIQTDERLSPLIFGRWEQQVAIDHNGADQLLQFSQGVGSRQKVMDSASINRSHRIRFQRHLR